MARFLHRLQRRLGLKDALLAGADCWFSSIGGILPEAVVQLAAAAWQGDTERAHLLDEKFGALWALMKGYGSLRVAYAVARYRDGPAIAPVRPVQPLPHGANDKVKAALAMLEA